MRGEHDAHPAFGHGLHEAPQELPPGQGVETGDRLIEQQKLGALGHGQGEGELGPLPSGELAGFLVGVETEVLDAALGQGVVPAGVEPGPEPEMIRDR